MVKVMDTNGKYSNSYVISKEINSKSIITFTIDSIEYQAEEGMTWEEWISSTYNVDSFYYWLGFGITKDGKNVICQSELTVVRYTIYYIGYKLSFKTWRTN